MTGLPTPDELAKVAAQLSLADYQSVAHVIYALAMGRPFLLVQQATDQGVRVGHVSGGLADANEIIDATYDLLLGAGAKVAA